MDQTRRDLPPQHGPAAQGTAAARLRADTDVGRTGDKVDFPDPAAAPLGTDAEAAGTRPEAAAVFPRVPAGPAPQADAGGYRSRAWLFAAGLVLLVVVALMIAVARI